MTPRPPLVALAVLLFAPAASWAAVPPPIKGPGCGGLDGSLVTGAVAESLVMAAAGRSEVRARQLKEIPVEFAGSLLVLPYGNEELGKVSNPTKEQAAAILEEKAGYWKLVQEALDKEKAKNDKEAEKLPSHDERIDAFKRSTRLSKLGDAVAAIRQDIITDQATLADGKEKNQALIDRKLTLAKKLAALNPPPAAKKP